MIIFPEHVTVTCDGSNDLHITCTEKAEFDTTEYQGETFGVSEDSLNSLGWCEADGQFCPKCSLERDLLDPEEAERLIKREIITKEDVNLYATDMSYCEACEMIHYDEDACE